MTVYHLILGLMAFSTLFCLLVWVSATAYRLLYPDEPRPLPGDPLPVLRRSRAPQRAMPVGVREIRAAQRQRRATVPPIRYYYDPLCGHGVPDAWKEDMWERRN